jgi:RHS repeat-associated protein
VVRLVREDGSTAKALLYRDGRVVEGLRVTRVADRYEYTGREFFKGVKLQYSRARWYSPGAGRWLSEDPLGFGAGDTNLYRYVGNSHLNYTDPSGKCLFTVLGGLIGGAVGGIGAALSTGDWSWERVSKGAAAGAMVGAGIGLLADTAGASGLVSNALIGAGLSAGAASGAFSAGAPVSWEGFAKGALVGAVGAVAGGALTMGLTKGLTGLMTARAAGVVSGVAGGVAGSAAGQVAAVGLGLQERFDLGSMAFAGAGAGLGALAAGWLTRNMVHQTGPKAGQILCEGVTRGQWILRSTLGGVAGAALGDLADQTVNGRFKTSHAWALQNQPRLRGIGFIPHLNVIPRGHAG